MTLLSLASKQIWPQVLAVAHLEPKRVFLLHSEDVTESKGPALRLKRLFDASGLVPRGATHLEVIPHVQFPGERLTLSEKGWNAAAQDLSAKLSAETRLDRGSFDFRKWLHIENPSRREPSEGNNLEYGTACALLKADVPVVRRSVELATLPNSGNSEGELDLVFNWNGRLWVVDCKDHVGGETKLESLRTALLVGGSANRQTESLLKSIAEDLKDRDIKILREDLLQISEVGGLLGCALAVRSAKPPRQAIEFAASRHPHVEILLKSDLVKRLPAILAGRRPR